MRKPTDRGVTELVTSSGRIRNVDTQPCAAKSREREEGSAGHPPPTTTRNCRAAAGRLLQSDLPRQEQKTSAPGKPPLYLNGRDERKESLGELRASGQGDGVPVQTPELQAHRGQAAGDKSTKLSLFIITQFLKKL